VKVGNLVQNIYNPITLKPAGEEVGIVVELTPDDRALHPQTFKIVMLGETQPHKKWKMVSQFEVIG
jgi:hypothetical protein